jgi:hypothetical protein
MKYILLSCITFVFIACTSGGKELVKENLSKEEENLYLSKPNIYIQADEMTLFKANHQSSRLNEYDAVPNKEIAEKLTLVYYDYIKNSNKLNVKDFTIDSKMVNNGKIWKILIVSNECSSTNSYCDKYYYYFYLNKFDGEFLLTRTLKPSSQYEKYPPRL